MIHSCSVKVVTRSISSSWSSYSVAVFILHVPPRKLLEDAPSVERKGLGLREFVTGKVVEHRFVVQGRFKWHDVVLRLG